ncbi:MAG: alpha-ketoacid dehydrogenase subunit beta [Lautropia sp.]
MAEVRFAAAVNRALADAMEADSRVVLFGEDVARPGGAFAVTRGLLERFGPMRVRDTPISEGAIAAAAVGAALGGLRPVVEIMFMDFLTLAMDAIVNQAAKAHFMFGGQCAVPMVVRTQHGGSLSAGPQHSQCLEAWFAHVPGLKVIVPSSPGDAYALLRAAIDDPNPVIFVEHKALYATKGELAPHPQPARIGHAKVLRQGRDLTLVSYGACVRWSLEAAELVCAENIDVEVIDLCSVMPWDVDTVLQSVGKTGRFVIAHEAVRDFGVGAEIAAVVGERSFQALRSPIGRVGSHPMPVPFAPALEKAYLPTASRIAGQIRKTMIFNRSPR